MHRRWLFIAHISIESKRDVQRLSCLQSQSVPTCFKLTQQLPF